MAPSKTKQEAAERTATRPVIEKHSPAPQHPFAPQREAPARLIGPDRPAANRAQAGIALQRSVGNARVGQLLTQTTPPLAQRITAAQEAGGSPLGPGERTRLEPVLGADLGGVRLHTDG